jgi:hypothetical protein
MAQSGRCWLKYNQLQKIFSNPLRPNKKYIRNLSALVLETRHAPQPLKAHKQKIVDQMMPKAASGGFHSGCFSDKYHGPISVSQAPMDETIKVQPNAIAKPTNRSKMLMP